MTGQFPKYCENKLASTVADIRISFNLEDLPADLLSSRSFKIISRKSPKTERSCTSSTTMCETSARSRSPASFRRRIPVVQKRSLVRGFQALSRRT
eukprot:Gb_05412 [translate_table: standard]